MDRKLISTEEEEEEENREIGIFASLSRVISKNSWRGHGILNGIASSRDHSIPLEMS